jgi:hypothetical protein
MKRDIAIGILIGNLAATVLVIAAERYATYVIHVIVAFLSGHGI